MKNTKMNIGKKLILLLLSSSAFAVNFNTVNLQNAGQNSSDPQVRQAQPLANSSNGNSEGNPSTNQVSTNSSSNPGQQQGMSGNTEPGNITNTPNGSLVSR